jgi:hypothetical protein
MSLPHEAAFRPQAQLRERRAQAKPRLGFSKLEISLAVAGFVAWFTTACLVLAAVLR